MENATHSPRVFTIAEDISIKTLYVLAVVMDIAGNTAVSYIILKQRRLQNTVNLLLLNLSIADLVAGYSVLPYVFVEMHKTNLSGVNANLVCGLFADGLTMFFIGSCVSLLTLSILSISRYILINHPLRTTWRIQKDTVKWLSLFSWAVATALLIPSGLSFKYDKVTNICWRTWAPGVNPFVYFMATLVLGMLVPLSALTFTYISTTYTLWFKKSTRRLTQSNSRTSVQMYRKRVSILLGLLIIVYMLCWLPFGLYWLLSVVVRYFPKTMEGQVTSTRATKITILFGLFNTCLDPLVYYFSNRQIRAGAIRLMRRRNANAVEPTATDP